MEGEGRGKAMRGARGRVGRDAMRVGWYRRERMAVP